MAKKKKKEVNYKEMDIDDLHKQLDKNQQELFKLKFRAGQGANKNVMQIRTLRRDSARIHTFINQKRAQTV